ncbi:UNKNOWN [Stylonychia lemnae]|uniref:GTF3C1 extended winged-helix domain-containing protein n=1 Tax=Stylonychia lemnae TaxID=5949 RepID=A0A078AAP9_STYLE|nr:UNKNOWN [Stylonychia lemnae]|eukprot:CDW77868.1 UNKNOWN [Stylonychia lemnae]
MKYQQFYKKEENAILFNLYNIICQNAMTKDLVYSEICKKYNEKYAQSKGKRTHSNNKEMESNNTNYTAKLTTLDVAHYCKKLEKCGFIHSHSNISTSEKKISLAKREKIKASVSQFNGIRWDQLGEIYSAKDDEKNSKIGKNSKRKRAESIHNVKQEVQDFNSDQKLLELRSLAIKRQKIIHKTFLESSLTMRESIIRVLENKIDAKQLKFQEIQDQDDSESDNEQTSVKDLKINNQDLYEDGKYTISDISVALGMNKEEKTMSRVLAELKKIHKDIESSAVRNGRVFQYKYYLKYLIKQEDIDKRIQSIRKREQKEEIKGVSNSDGKPAFNQQVKQEIIYENPVLQMLKSPQSLLISLNDKSYGIIVEIQTKKNMIKFGHSKDDIIMDYFQDIIQEGKVSSARRQLTVETINRYIYCLNKVTENGHISLVDLRNDIKNELEKNKGFEIDKKTLKRIIEKLKKDNLVKTVDFLVNIQQADGFGQQNMVKTLVLDTEFDQNSAILMDNPTISNPTNRISESKQTPIKQEGQRNSSYSLRTRRNQVKYRDESVNENSEDHEENNSRNNSAEKEIIESPMKEMKQLSIQDDVEMIKAQIQQDEEQKIAYIERNKVLAINLGKILIKIQNQNTKRSYNQSIHKFIEFTTLPKELQINRIFQSRISSKNKNFITAFTSIMNLQPKKCFQHEPPSLIDFNAMLLDPYIDSMIEHDMDQFTDVTLNKFNENENSLSNITTQRKSAQDGDDVIMLLEMIIFRENQKTKKQKRVHQYPFYAEDIYVQKVAQISKILSRTGRVAATYLQKEFSTIYAAAFTFYHLAINGYVKIERDLDDRIFIDANPSINDLYLQLSR